MRSSLVCLSVATLAACSKVSAETTRPAPAPVVAAAAARSDAGAPPPRPDVRNVVLLTIDSLRADMPWAGYPRPIAPRLTQLEARAVSYAHGYAISSYTSMSLGGLLGGKLPGEMRRDGFFFGTYPPGDLMFPELLQAAHVHTLGAQAHAYFRDPSLSQGFDAWQLVPGITFKNTTDENITSPQQEALAERLLSDRACDAPGRFFAWFHFMDPHDEYKSHEPEIPPWGKTPRDRYDGEVQFTDKYVGKLVDFIASRPWGETTAIIVTADHGEGLGDHGQAAHGFELWQNLVRVPLFFVVPGAAPRRIEVPRSALDLAPTLLDLFGLPPEPTFEGESLLPEIQGGPAEPRDIVLDLPATSDSERRRAIVHDKWKLVAFGEDKPYGDARPAVFELFDLELDPGETRPINRGEDFAAMVKRYRELEARVKDVMPYSCREDCLNGAYHKRDAGTSREDAAR